MPNPPEGDDRNFHLFPTTHWSMVARAGQDAPTARRDALGDLLRRYLDAFRSFVTVRYHLPRDRAEDLVQGFIASRVIEKNLIGKADAARGKFRNFLMTALERYAVDQFREAAALKRQGDRNPVDLQETQDGITGGEDPAAVFDRFWAVELVRQAVDEMRKATATERPELWVVFQERVIGPAFDGVEPASHAELVARLGFKDEGQAANTLQTAKRIFARIVRGLAAEYAATADDVDDEVKALLGALAR